MVVRPTKKGIVSEFRRTAILRAARKVFARRGYDGATMDDVAEACSIAKGTLYLYFKSKRQIYLAVVKEDLTSLREATQAGIERATTATDKVRAFVTTRFEFCERNRDFFRIYNSDASSCLANVQPAEKDAREFYLAQAELLRGIIEQGIREGDLRDVPARAAAFAIYDMTRASIARRLLGIGSGDGDAQSLLDLILKGISRS